MGAPYESKRRINIMATKTKEELLKELEALKAELEQMKADKAAQESVTEAPKGDVTPTGQPIVVTTKSTDVEVVYTSNSMGHMEGKLFSLDATVYGETFTLSRGQFDELVGKYRHWFKDGRLAVSHKYIDIAAAKDLPIDTNIGVTVNDLRNLGNMSVDQIEDLWNKATAESLRMSIVSYYKEKYVENVAGFRDRTRVDCLNRLTDGAFDYEVQALGGRGIKLPVRDFVKE